MGASASGPRGYGRECAAARLMAVSSAMLAIVAALVTAVQGQTMVTSTCVADEGQYGRSVVPGRRLA